MSVSLALGGYKILSSWSAYDRLDGGHHRLPGYGCHYYEEG